ncbi:MAG: HDIG domain-containing metalloprotein, partial [Candidatus Aminicenantia bacterium]
KVYTILIKVSIGKIILKKGEKVSQEDFQIISALKKKIGVPLPFQRFLFYFFVILSGFLMALPFYRIFSFFDISPRKRHLLFLTLIFFEIFILKLFSYFSDGLKHKDLLTFAVPFFLFSLLISYLLDRKAGIFFTFLNIIPLTIFYLEKPKLILYAILSSFLASAGVNIYSRVERYSIIKFIILKILPFNAFLIFILSWAGNNFSDFIYMLGGMFLGIVFSLIFAPILIPALEISFGILSEIRLAELGNSEHPLLKKMAIEAPGTYHHSLMVSNLAEHAVRAIGANYHLARVSALFHDMGKLDEPSYFIENQEKDFNIHDRLSPEKSSSIIINHISKGIEILKKARIPSLIREIVQQHHGESLIALFYHKALSETESKGGTPHESLFRYPGPKPQSKEAGILMLSDAVEAASKSLSEWNPETIKKMINEIITRFFEDGQLDESELTIKDLYVVASSFYNTFIKFYKQRIPYPGFEFQKDQLPIQ